MSDVTHAALVTWCDNLTELQKGKAHMTRCEAVARRDVVHVVALPTPPRLLSTALTMILLRMSARNASYQALLTTSSRKASAAPARNGTAQSVGTQERIR